MVDIEELDRDLYMSWFTNKDITDKNQIWNSIKDNNEILKEAIEVERNKWDTANTLKGIVVAHFILANFDSVDREIYDSLVHIIYNDVDIARIVVDGAANGGFSFLLLTLMNPELKLTEKQKEFAINEAMNKVGTVKCEKRQEEYLKKLESIGITDDMNGEVDIKGIGKISIGAKTKQEYFNSLMISLDNTQAHGVGCFDIRYHILKNDNWSYDEKKVLVMDFWADQEDYDRSLEVNGHSLFMHSGDTLTLNQVPVSGFVTSSAKIANLLVPMGKSLADISTITVTACKGGIRTSEGGYLNGGSDSSNWLDTYGVTVTATKVNDFMINLRIQSETAFTKVTNNTPLSLWCNPVTLAFS